MTIRWTCFFVESSPTEGEFYHSIFSVTVQLGVGKWLPGEPLGNAGDGVVGQGGGAQSSYSRPSRKPEVKLKSLSFCRLWCSTSRTCVRPSNFGAV